MTPDQHIVLIDRVKYVPVREAIDADSLAQRVENAIVSQWAGDNWREHYPDAPSYIKVVVGDSFDADEGESVAEFVARVIG